MFLSNVIYIKKEKKSLYIIHKNFKINFININHLKLLLIKTDEIILINTYLLIVMFNIIIKYFQYFLRTMTTSSFSFGSKT